jgi:hypothetical protein
VDRWGNEDFAGGIAVSPGPLRPGRSAALDLAEWWIGGWADLASLCSQLVDLGEGLQAQGAGRKVAGKDY